MELKPSARRAVRRATTVPVTGSLIPKHRRRKTKQTAARFHRRIFGLHHGTEKRKAWATKRAGAFCERIPMPDRLPTVGACDQDHHQAMTVRHKGHNLYPAVTVSNVSPTCVGAQPP